MENSIESNSKIKALIIILIATIVLAGSSLFSTVRAADEEGEEPQTQQEVEQPEEEPQAQDNEGEKPEIKLNRKVYFIGKTYRANRKDARVKKEYTEEKPGCGIILSIKKSETEERPYGLYILGEGYISRDQVIDSKKFIDITFNLNEDKSLTAGLKIDGEFTNVNVENTAFIKFENGELMAGVKEGSTNIVFTKKDGTPINVLATNHNGNITLSIENKMISAEFVEDATLFDKIQVEATGNGNITVGFEDGKFTAVADGQADLIVKDLETDQEIVNGEISGEARLDASLEGVEVSGTSNQTLSILQRINIALNERAGLAIDKQQVKVNAGGNVAVGENELLNVDGEVEYTYGAEDPTGSIEGQIFGQGFSKAGKIPVISTVKALLNKIK